MAGGEMWTQLGSSLAGLMFVWAMFKQYCPFEMEGHLQKYTQKLVSLIYPYIEINFHEFTSEGFYERSKAYGAIQRYLTTNSTARARRLKADMVQDSKSLVLSMDDHEEITDEFMGRKVWWASNKNTPRGQVISFYGDEEKRFYKLKFHRRDREIIYGTYLKHVMDEGKAIEVKSRQRKLYTNNRNEQWTGRSQRTMWSSVVFEHPATFDTLAMEEKKKKEIMNDLITFTKSKDYYKKIGKAWKRGYLLFGPPGTGKSTMIAAMANLLDYDVYDLELTSVKDNTELRKLLIDTSNKSIIVIEDIDCSLDLTGQRKNKKEEKEEEGDGKDPVSKKKKEDQEKSNESSKVTLSGLLNFIDGLWSACGGERIIVFTTNYVEKLDPALIRRGRMDKHIELSYCCFEAFRVLARNYLDLESHHLFGTIGKLLEETKISPADVAENLMPKEDEDADACLANLIEAIEKAKEEARVKAEEEEKDRAKAEKEEKDKEKEQKSDEAEEEKKTAGEEVKENGV